MKCTTEAVPPEPVPPQAVSVGLKPHMRLLLTLTMFCDQVPAALMSTAFSAQAQSPSGSMVPLQSEYMALVRNMSLSSMTVSPKSMAWVESSGRYSWMLSVQS